jgi:hypothetical protein
MKKLTFLILISIGFFPFVKSQTVDSIKVEQAGELIKVHYKILNSNEFQVFRVTVYCSINGGLKSELKSLSGDFGNSVVGGRPDYMVLWDVLKDVDEVKSVDFSVKAELLKDETPKLARISKRNPLGGGLYAMGVMEVPQTGFGARIGYMRGWGISFWFITGSINRSEDTNGNTVQNLEIPDFAAGFDLTKRLVNKESFKMHLYAGACGSVYPEWFNAAENRFWKDSFTGLSLGIISNYKMIAFSGGIITLQHGEISTHLGLGVRF